MNQELWSLLYKKVPLHIMVLNGNKNEFYKSSRSVEFYSKVLKVNKDLVLQYLKQYGCCNKPFAHIVSCIFVVLFVA